MATFTGPKVRPAARKQSAAFPPAPAQNQCFACSGATSSCSTSLDRCPPAVGAPLHRTPQQLRHTLPASSLFNSQHPPHPLANDETMQLAAATSLKPCAAAAAAAAPRRSRCAVVVVRATAEEPQQALSRRWGTLFLYAGMLERQGMLTAAALSLWAASAPCRCFFAGRLWRCWRRCPRCSHLPRPLPSARMCARQCRSEWKKAGCTACSAAAIPAQVPATRGTCRTLTAPPPPPHCCACAPCRKEARKQKLKESAAKMKASQKADSAFDDGKFDPTAPRGTPTGVTSN